MHRFLNMSCRWFPVVLVAIGAGAMLTGCGPRSSQLSGTVRYNGKPLEQGNLQFLGADGIPRTAPLGPGGSFMATVPAGTVKVLITSVDETRLNQFTSAQTGRGGPGGRAVPPTAKGSFLRIPLRFADWDTSGLTVEIGDGVNVHDFELAGP